MTESSPFRKWSGRSPRKCSMSGTVRTRVVAASVIAESRLRPLRLRTGGFAGAAHFSWTSLWRTPLNAEFVAVVRCAGAELGKCGTKVSIRCGCANDRYGTPSLNASLRYSIHRRARRRHLRANGLARGVYNRALPNVSTFRSRGDRPARTNRRRG